MQDSNHNHHIPTPPFSVVNSGGGPGGSLQRMKPPQLPIRVPTGHVAFRLLCHASRIGGVIGKSGSIIKQLQQETGARIRIEDSFPNSDSDDHRVIVIIGSASTVKRVALDVTERTQEDETNDDDEGVDLSAAQDAVVRVFERVIEVAAESDGVAIHRGGLVSCRLLARVSQVGAVIGKGGKVVEKIRRDTGCKIKVLTSEKLQSCGDEMVEIEGDILAVRKALVAVTSCLQDCATAMERAKMNGSKSEEAQQQTLPDPHVDFPPQRITLPDPVVVSSSNNASGSRPLSVEGDRIPVMESRSPQLEVVFRILCLNDRVGGVIGKGGSIVRTLQAETGASIIVGPTIAECDERLITITASESPDSQQSAAQNAALRVFDKCTAADKGVDSSSKSYQISLRLVVPSNQVGCLLGKGGALISETRKLTSTSIWIVGGDQLPKCASRNDEVVQITGGYANVRNALYNVTGRLRDNLCQTRLRSSIINESSPHGKVGDPPQLGLHSSADGAQHPSQHNTLAQSMENLGISEGAGRPPSPALWKSQIVLGAKHRSINDAKGLTSVKGGLELGSGSRSAIVTNTAMEIVVPENIFDSVYGENGCNLIRLRQISGAKVMLHDPRPGTTDRTLVISGSPDETQAAQSLLQAFILAGSS